MNLRLVHWIESRFSLGVKISALIIFTMLATSTCLSYLIYIKSYKALEWELKIAGIRLASDLAKRSAPILITGDTWELYKSTRDATQKMMEMLDERDSFNSIEFAAVLDLNNRIAAHSNPKMFPLNSTFTINGELIEDNKERGYRIISERKLKESEILHIYSPIKIHNKTIGQVVVGISKKRLNAGVKRLRNEVILTSLVMGAAFILIGFFLSRRFLRPIYEMSERMKNLPSDIVTGAYEPDPRHKDEIIKFIDYANTIINRYGMVTSELKVEKEKLDNILNGIHAGMIVVDCNFKTKWLNRLQVEWFGGKLEEKCFNNNITKLNCEDCPVKSALLYEDIFSCKVERKLQSGEVRIFSIIAAPLHDNSNRIQGALELSVDITDQVRIEEEMKRKEQLALMGQMAAGIAHELRNPLNSIVTALKLVSKDSDIKSSSKKETLMTVIRKETERLNNILSDFLSYTHKKEPRKTPNDLNLLLSEIIDLLKQEHDGQSSINFSTKLQKDLPLVPIQSDSIKQVLWNLAKNGIQSMESCLDGVLSVETEVDNSFIVIRVRDTGKGMSAKDCQECFTPFYTTKPGGTGLGMAISKRIVEDHGGKISVSSREGEGTEFSVFLPYSMKSEKPTPTGI